MIINYKLVCSELEKCIVENKLTNTMLNEFLNFTISVLDKYPESRFVGTYEKHISAGFSNLIANWRDLKKCENKISEITKLITEGIKGLYVKMEDCKI